MYKTSHPMRSTSNESLPCTHYAGTVLGAGGGYHGASGRCCPALLHCLLGSVVLLNSWPSQYGLLYFLSASGSPEAFPQPSCLHVPHSAPGIFFILQDPVHKLTSLESLPNSPVGSTALSVGAGDTAGYLCLHWIPSDLRLFVGQFPHQSISF